MSIFAGPKKIIITLITNCLIHLFILIVSLLKLDYEGIKIDRTTFMFYPERAETTEANGGFAVV